jgi:ParB-like chromosome segregation protein Spo0J
MATEKQVIGAASGREIERFKNYFDGSGGDTGFISVNDIIVQKGFNSRNFKLPENRAHLDSLKVEIAAYGGVHTPIKVKFDHETKQVILVDGESRYLAVKELNAEAGEEKYLMLATAAPKSKVGTEADMLELSLSANTGKPFSQWEVGTAYEKLTVAGRSVETIAKRFAKSERYVRDAIDLAPAPDAIKIALSNGEITVAVALKALRKDGGKAVETIAKAVTEQKAKGGGKVKAGYVKRAQITKVPNDFLARLHKHFSSQYDFAGDNKAQKLIAELEGYLPADKAAGQASKQLENF